MSYAACSNDNVMCTEVRPERREGMSWGGGGWEGGVMVVKRYGGGGSSGGSGGMSRFPSLGPFPVWQLEADVIRNEAVPAGHSCVALTPHGMGVGLS